MSLWAGFYTYISLPQSLIHVLCLSAPFFMLPNFPLYLNISRRCVCKRELQNWQQNPVQIIPSEVSRKTKYCYLLLHSHLWLHIELPYFMLFTQLSLLLIMKISNRGKHEWTLHGQNNLWAISILVIGHWHKNLAQDMKVWGFTSTSSILDLPTCQMSSAERTWSSMQTFSLSFLCVMEDPCYRLNIKYTNIASVTEALGTFILGKNKSSP